MGYALRVSIQMTDMQCCSCGIQYAVPESWREEKLTTGAGWYCPNGHGQTYGDSAADMAKKKLAQERARHDATLSRLNQAQEHERKTAAEMKRLKKCASAGVCPCCNRTFQALARHMHTKHPDYKA